MKRILLKIGYLWVAVLTTLACTEKNIDGYNDIPRIFFQIPGTGSVSLRDSIIYSFPANLELIDQDTLWFNACIMGPPAPYDRPFAVTVNQALSTAVEGEHFEFKQNVIPANAYKTAIPIIIFRKGLKDKSVRLEIEVQANENFKVGFERYSKAIFIWGDMFLKPDIWDTSNYRFAFGDFTQTRYKFILKACSLTELPDPANIALLAYYNAMVRKALDEYNRTPGNEPMADENGAVGFPIYTGIGGVG